MSTDNITVNISDMTCTSCANRLQKALENSEGVESASVNFAVEKAYVGYDPEKTSKDALISTIQKAGYKGKIDKPDITHVDFKISGMTCSACAQRIERNLNKLDDVEANVNFATEKASINYNPSKISLSSIKEAINKAGYNIIKEDIAKETDPEERKIKEAAWRMWWSISLAGVVMILMMIHMFVTPIPYYFPTIAALGFPVIFYFGVETHKATWNALKNKSASMDTLVTMGSAIPYFLNFLGFWLPITSFIELTS